MIYGSVCSGIEAASMAWKGLGWRGAFVSEIEAFPRAVLKHHHPEIPPSAVSARSPAVAWIARLNLTTRPPRRAAEVNLAKRALTDAEFTALCSDVMAWLGERIALVDGLDV